MKNFEIDWEIGDRYDGAGDGHTYFHFAEGEDSKGNKFSATAVLVDGELDAIEDIEDEND